MPDRDQTQINYVFAATALAVGMSLGVALSHAFWRMDFMLMNHDADGDAAPTAIGADADPRGGDPVEPMLDLLAFRARIHAYDALESVLDASNRIGRLFDDIPDEAIPLALDLIDDIETRMAKRRAIEVLFTRWAELQPASALQAAGSLENRMSREAAQQAVLAVWLLRDPDRARQYIAQAPDDRGRERLLRHAIAALGDQAPAQSAELLMALDDAAMRGRRLPRLANSWGRIDPSAALQWANQRLKEPAEHANFVSEAVYGWALERPAEALEYVRNVAEDGDGASRDLVVEVLRGWAAEDPAAAVGYIMRFDSKEEQAVLMHAIAEALSAAEPDSILAWTDALEGERGEAVLAQLIEHKLESEPVSAARLALQLREGDLRTTIYSDLARSWANHDTETGIEWLTALAPSPSRDAAVTSFANAVFADRPRTALDLAAGIEDVNGRAETLTMLLERWLLNNPADAERWLAENAGIRKP